MRILHYSLGFPPYRSGGMTKCSMDLMLKQKEQNCDVALIWPGYISSLNRKVNIKKRKDNLGIESFEIINALPISLNGGITDIEAYTKRCINPDKYKSFLNVYEPDIIHIHTLMGLHKEFIEIAKQKGIKIVFTTHDYFGICPKVTLFRNGQACESGVDCVNCTQCNVKALSMKKIKILQSPIYRKAKELWPVKVIRRTFKEAFFEENKYADEYKGDNNPNDYITLRKYYIDILKLVDKVHYNSTLSKEIYEQYIPFLKGEVINISHNAIKNNKKIKQFENKIKITYLASPAESKGYSMLLSVLDEIWDEGEEWFRLNLYNNSNIEKPYINMHGQYKYSDLNKIFVNTDVLVAPSLWYETFGYTVLEALSYGVPVIVSENVGAKDLVKDMKFGRVIEPCRQQLKETLLLLKDKTQLEQFNECIVNEFNVEQIMNFYMNMKCLYDDLIGE